jgi:hypothetical protein
LINSLIGTATVTSMNSAIVRLLLLESAGGGQSTQMLSDPTYRSPAFLCNSMPEAPDPPTRAQRADNS